jgi:hypothetical protein
VDKNPPKIVQDVQTEISLVNIEWMQSFRELQEKVDNLQKKVDDMANDIVVMTLDKIVATIEFSEYRKRNQVDNNNENNPKKKRLF